MCDSCYEYDSEEDDWYTGDKTLSFNPKLNIPLARKTLEWVEEQSKFDWGESEWDQDTWIQKRDWCGTKACYAGHAVLLMGWEPIFEAWGGADFVVKDGIRMPVDHAAMKELGITPNQADLLFDAENKADNLRCMLEKIAGEKL